MEDRTIEYTLVFKQGEPETTMSVLAYFATLRMHGWAIATYIPRPYHAIGDWYIDGIQQDEGMGPIGWSELPSWTVNILGYLVKERNPFPMRIDDIILAQPMTNYKLK